MEGYGKRVLIAEDDETGRNLLSMLLERAGYSVYVAFDGRQAVEELKKRRFDAVITDHHMPKMNGFQLVLLGRLVWPDVPMILLSGDDRSLAAMAEQGGAYGCLRKPYDSAELLGVMRGAIQSTQERRLRRSTAQSLPA